MSVSCFAAEGSGDELGSGARSYLRQIDAWTKVTRTPADQQQALLLYQHLTGRAWIEAEELDVTQLASARGVEVFKTWIFERHQEIGKIAEALNGSLRSSDEATADHSGVQRGL